MSRRAICPGFSFIFENRGYNRDVAHVLSPEDVFFEVLTPLGFRVRVTRGYWEIIVSIKHPVMARHEQDVKETLENPNEIRLSKNDSTVHLFYRQKEIGRWVCAVVKRLDGEGFLITAYPTDAIKEGERIWPK